MWSVHFSLSSFPWPHPPPHIPLLSFCFVSLPEHLYLILRIFWKSSILPHLIQYYIKLHFIVQLFSDLTYKLYLHYKGRLAHVTPTFHPGIAFLSFTNTLSSRPSPTSKQTSYVWREPNSFLILNLIFYLLLKHHY